MRNTEAFSSGPNGPGTRWLTAGRLLRYAAIACGFAMGFGHLHGALELDVGLHRVTGSLAGTDVLVKGMTLTPATALLVTF